MGLHSSKLLNDLNRNTQDEYVKDWYLEDKGHWIR